MDRPAVAALPHGQAIGAGPGNGPGSLDPDQRQRVTRIRLNLKQVEGAARRTDVHLVRLRAVYALLCLIQRCTAPNRSLGLARDKSCKSLRVRDRDKRDFGGRPPAALSREGMFDADPKIDTV